MKAKFFLLLLLITTTVTSLAQEKKQEKKDTSKWINRNKVAKEFLGFITHDPVDNHPVLNTKSEAPYLPYAGKIVRRIIIRRLGFESTVLDTTQKFQTYVSKTANNLHVNTKEFVIRNNLFIETGKPLNPYRVADNERTLRTLSFILDARILVKRIAKTSDSVDLIVITRDLFSLGGSFEPVFPGRMKLIAQEVNVAGMGQRILVAGLYDIERNPNFGYEAIYEKTNVSGTFINAAVGYSVINTGSSLGNENENAFYLRINRPLYQPFARWAGGIELSNNYSKSVYPRSDSLFVPYRYTIQDYWGGYSFGQKEMPSNLKENRNRKFLAIRTYQQNFTDLPANLKLREQDRYTYRSRESILAQLTFFRQDFYKTQYVVGFGRTEDIPYGYRLSLTAGWEKELMNVRPYLGTELYYNKIQDSGTILTYTAKLATYIENRNPADGLLSLDFKRFSKIHVLGSTKIRHQIEVGYAWLFNQHVKRGIDIRDLNGITGFRPDSLVGTQRLLLNEEVIVYLRAKLLGFRMAPLMRIDLAMINRESPLVQKSNFFSGISIGVRARNEHLNFDTIEARIFYYPRTIERVQCFGFSFSTNFYIKYPTNLVTKPSTVFN